MSIAMPTVKRRSGQRFMQACLPLFTVCMLAMRHSQKWLKGKWHSYRLFVRFRALLDIAQSDAARQNIEKTVDAHLSAVNRAFEHKVRVLPGSDSGPKFIPYGSSYIDELRLFLKAGIPSEDVIRSAAGSDLD